MQWNSDLPDDWDDAPTNPPRTDAPDVEIVSVNGGVVCRPADEPAEGDVGTNSIFSEEVRDVGEGELHRWQKATSEFDDD